MRRCANELVYTGSRISGLAYGRLTIYYDNLTTNPGKMKRDFNNNNNYYYYYNKNYYYRRISVTPYGRNIGRRLVTARSNCSQTTVER